MQNIQEQVIANYQANMQYLQNKHEALYNKILALDTLLNEGRYPQKYDLEYVNGYFDVIELATGTFLYQEDSDKVSQKLADSTSFRKNDQVFESFYNYTYTPEVLKSLEDEDPLTLHSTAAHIINYHDTTISKDDSMILIPKYIFLGIGLGFHISKVLEKTKSNVLWIIEDDVELFRLSLFTTNYATLFANAKVHFSIGQNNTEFSEAFTAYYVDSFVRNHYLKFLSFSSAYEDKIRQIQTFILSRPEIGYPHEYLLYKNTKILSRLNEGYKFLDLSKKEHETYFDDKPFLVVGAGPSLHENLDWLKDNHENFIIIAVFAALRTLNKAGISPQIVIQIDEKVTETVNLVNSYDNFDFVKDALFIFAASVPDILLETFPKEQIYLIEDRTTYKHNNTSLISASVGESAYAISLIFNAKQTYVLGVDLALSKEGETHAKDHHMKNDVDTDNVNKLQKTAGMDDTVFYVKGNLRAQVATTPRFSISIPMFNRFTHRYKSNQQQVFNLSDGAYFENTIPTKISEIPTMGKISTNNLDNNLMNLFNKYTEDSLSASEMKNLQERLERVHTIYTAIEKFETAPTSTRDQFTHEYLQLLGSIVALKVDELYENLLVYFLNTSSYVVDLFNTQELDNAKKHTKHMKKFVISKLRKLIEFYEDALVKAIESK